jgi:hypothetical protein
MEPLLIKPADSPTADLGPLTRKIDRYLVQVDIPKQGALAACPNPLMWCDGSLRFRALPRSGKSAYCRGWARGRLPATRQMG